MSKRRGKSFRRGGLEEAISITTFSVQTDEINALKAELALRKRELNITAALQKQTASIHQRETNRQAEENKKLVDKSTTDHLTRALNRHGWQEKLDDLKEQSAAGALDGKVVGIVLADLDHFKKYNDQHGHPEGDIALQDYFQALREVLKEGDVLGRYGGEEAIIILVADRLNLEKIGQRYVDAVADYAGRRGPQITASFGLTLWPGATFHQNDIEKSVIPITDKQLYQAKERGRNCAVVDAQTGFIVKREDAYGVDKYVPGR